MTDRHVAVLLGFLVAVLGGAPLVGLALRLVVRAADRAAIAAFRGRGLRVGGAVIGALERSLVLAFVLAGEFGAIGLILAAKGLIRYGEIKDSKDQKVAEYVLIGTMLSLLWALAVGMAVNALVPPAASSSGG